LAGDLGDCGAGLSIGSVLDDLEPAKIGAVAAATLPWLAALALVYLRRRPSDPATGPPTLDLGPEPPAVANLLVHGFRPTREAVPATLLDLAARGFVEIEQRGPERFVCRLRTGPEESLTSFDRRVLELLRRRVSGGIVPAEALTTGPKEESKRWWRGFRNDVISESKRRGLSRDILDKSSFTALSLLAAAPAALASLLFQFEVGIGYWLAAVALLGVVRDLNPQQDTPAGLAAASGWLGVRAKLAEDEVFRRQTTPIAVALWDRHLAYGAALGVAGGTVRYIPMGAESDRDAWSSYGGGWRRVRIRYSRAFSPGWGQYPVWVALRALVPAVIALLVLYVAASILADLDSDLTGFALLIVGAILLVPALVLAVAVIVIGVALADLWSSREVSGQILRLRTFGPKDDATKQSHYIAVDDGRAAKIIAWRARPELLTGLNQYDVVTVSVTRRLGYVRSIKPAPSEQSPAAEPGLARLTS
jgi:predicted membrane protein DUF2207